MMGISNTNSLYIYEEKLWNSGVGLIAGVDEAGRGPLAGPVCAAAVILNPDIRIEGINDSKKLSEKKRNLLFDEVVSSAIAYSIVFVNHLRIDRINILNATLEAMRLAVENLKQVPSMTLIDGDKLPKLDEKYGAKQVIGGDALSASIAAASILAKVSRDRQMIALAEKYPHYGFERHKGYGTKLHYEAMAEFGITPIHRKTFLKKYYETKPLEKKLGKWGEIFAGNEMKKLGYQTIEKNFHSRYGEIDLIVENGQKLVFLEVKTLSSSDSYAPREKVGHTKQQKIIRTAEIYLADHPSELEKEFAVFEIIVKETADMIKIENFEYIENAFMLS